ncbi:MAG TPA: hypothetical protein VK179_12955 [Bacteroidales bacterium]|nr:hypothetical protein [Bacteroidales bacterium]
MFRDEAIYPHRKGFIRSAFSMVLPVLADCFFAGDSGIILDWDGSSQ